MDNIGIHLKQTIDQFIRPWEETYSDYREIIPHYDKRMKKGWIPMDVVLYNPVIKKEFSSENELAKEIIGHLENKDIGKYELEKNGSITLGTLQAALEEIMEHVPMNIYFFMCDFGPEMLMLDREAYGTSSNPAENCIQWYIRK